METVRAELADTTEGQIGALQAFTAILRARHWPAPGTEGARNMAALLRELAVQQQAMSTLAETLANALDPRVPS